MAVLRTSEAVREFSLSAVRHRIDRNIWQRPCRGVVVTHNGPLTPGERFAIALASAPPGSALTGPTALAIDGFIGLRDPRIHLTIPRGGRHPSFADAVVHVSRELSEADVHPMRSPRRTRPARSVIDAASWQESEPPARAIVIGAMQQGMVSVRSIREALTRRGPCRHRGIIIESVLDASGGIQSLPERDFAAIWVATGLPPPSRQRKVRRPDGHYYLDAFSAEFGFGVEIHGIPHLGVDQWDADLVRANEIVIGGTPILQFTSFAVRRQPRIVAAQLIAMAVSRGWNRTDRPALALLGQSKRRTVGQITSANAGRSVTGAN